MAINKQKKGEIIEKLTRAISGAESLVFVNFRGLNVTESTKLRKTLTSKKIGYVVAKKTLLKRALDTTKTEGKLPSLDGEVALVYLPAPAGGQAGGADSIEPAREIHLFQKDHREQVKILGGVFEGRYLDATAMTEIANIPSKEVLYGQLVGMFASPIRGFVVALSEIAKSRETQSI